MNQKTNEQQVQFYLKLAIENARGVQKKICAANSISLNPTSFGDLRPIPVYESEFEHNLLATANSFKPTVIRWATASQYEYLPAYYKRKKDNGRINIEIVVATENYCEARFFAAKELMHCFFDEEHHAPTSSLDMVNELIETLAINNAGWDVKPQTLVDQVAWWGALEYLIPNEWIPMLLRLHDEICQKEPESASKAHFHLAQLIRVPEAMLRTKLRHVPKAIA